MEKQEAIISQRRQQIVDDCPGLCPVMQRLGTENQFKLTQRLNEIFVGCVAKNKMEQAVQS
jgi:hypothetical protein